MNIFFEIKKNNRWNLVQASGMKEINEYCKNNGFSDWRICGMMSRDELRNKKVSAPVVG